MGNQIELSESAYLFWAKYARGMAEGAMIEMPQFLNHLFFVTQKQNRLYALVYHPDHLECLHRTDELDISDIYRTLHSQNENAISSFQFSMATSVDQVLYRARYWLKKRLGRDDIVATLDFDTLLEERVKL
jgi:hypothetical protein